MGYVDITPYFCMAMETVSDLANKVIAHQDGVSVNLLEQAVESRTADGSGTPESQADASWEHLPA